jgi:hypothetical protein
LRAQGVDEYLPYSATPGGSAVPRANTTATSGHGWADANGTGALSSAAEVVTIAAPRKRAMWRALTSTTSRCAHSRLLDEARNERESLRAQYAEQLSQIQQNADARVAALTQALDLARDATVAYRAQLSGRTDPDYRAADAADKT